MTICLYPLLPVPCPQSNLQATLDCSTDSALISWMPGNGILNYSASAEGFDVNHKVSCSTSGSFCNVTNLHCGNRYQVLVEGEGLTCPSQSDEWIALKTGNKFKPLVICYSTTTTKRLFVNCTIMQKCISICKMIFFCFSSTMSTCSVIHPVVMYFKHCVCFLAILPGRCVIHSCC